MLAVVTLNINGFSAYWFIWNIPGFNSIRAVTRIELVLMWPQAFFAAWALDRIVHQNEGGKQYGEYGAALLIIIWLVAESAFFPQSSYSKTEARARLENLRQSIPAVLPNSPILSFAYKGNEPAYLSELDAMLISQELGMSTMNGYSGNFPQGYDLPTSCAQIPNPVKKNILNS